MQNPWGNWDSKSLRKTNIVIVEALRKTNVVVAEPLRKTNIVFTEHSRRKSLWLQEPILFQAVNLQ
jgi:hypothetical protein